MTRTFDWNQTTREISMSELGDRDLAIRLSAVLPSDAMIDETILAARDRIMCLVKEKAALEDELAALRNQVRPLSDKAELADQYESWLLDIGKQVGCGHLDEQLPNCVISVLQGDRDIEELSRLREEAEWIREKLKLPKDSEMFGRDGVAGELHVICSNAHGFKTYIEARKCDDKEGEIARLTVEKAKLSTELDRIRNAGLESHDQVCQILGRSLGYPRYCDNQANFPGATDADGVCVGDHVAESIADEAAKRIAQLSEQVKVLDRYREVMEAAHGVRIYAVDHLLEHFNADGTLKGDGQWRLKEIYQHVKAFDESSSRAAEMADMQSPVMTDDTIDRLSGRELCDLCCIAVGDIGAAMGLLLQCGRGVEVYVYPSNQIIVTSSGCETTGPKSEAATIFCRASLKLKHRNPSL